LWRYNIFLQCLGSVCKHFIEGPLWFLCALVQAASGESRLGWLRWTWTCVVYLNHRRSFQVQGIPSSHLLPFRRLYMFFVLLLSLSMAGFFSFLFLVFFSFIFFLALMKFLNWSSWTSDATVDLFWLFCCDLIYINQDPGWRHKVYTSIFYGKITLLLIELSQIWHAYFRPLVMQIYSDFIYLNNSGVFSFLVLSCFAYLLSTTWNLIFCIAFWAVHWIESNCAQLIDT